MRRPAVGFKEKNTTPATPTTSVKARAKPPYQTAIQRPKLTSRDSAAGSPAISPCSSSRSFDHSWLAALMITRHIPSSKNVCKASSDQKV